MDPPDAFVQRDSRLPPGAVRQQIIQDDAMIADDDN